MVEGVSIRVGQKLLSIVCNPTLPPNRLCSIESLWESMGGRRGRWKKWLGQIGSRHGGRGELLASGGSGLQLPFEEMQASRVSGRDGISG